MGRVLAVALVVLFASSAGCAEPLPASTVEPYYAGLNAAILRATPYPILMVDVDYVEGYAPSPAALEWMMKALTELTAKREVILLDPQPIPGHVPDPERRWTHDEFMEVAERTQSMELDPGRQGKGDTAYLHILYVDGKAADSWGKFAGLHLGGLIGLWPDAYRLFPSDLLHPRDVVREKHTLLHEVGHAFGLVNCGIEMTKPREADGCHSTNPDSVMSAMNGYVTVRPTQPWDTEPSQWFDEDDLADIRAFRDAPWP